MAVPLIIFLLVIGFIVACLLIGLTRETSAAMFAFTALGGVLMVLAGVMLQIDGLQLDNVATLTDAGAVTTVAYSAVDYASGWLKILADGLFYGGFTFLILAFVYTTYQQRAKTVDEWAI